MKWLLPILLLAVGCRTEPHHTFHLAAIEPPPLPPLPITSLASSAAVVAPKTTKLTLEWTPPADMTDIIGFIVYDGTNSGSYIRSFVVGLTNRAVVAFPRQRGQVDYFVATSVDVDGLESLPSNEVFWPDYNSPGRVVTNLVVSWSEPAATVFTAPAPTGPWISLGTIVGTNLVVSNNFSAQFFRADVMLGIRPE